MTPVRPAVEASTIGELVREAANRFGDADAVVGGGQRYTFRELDVASRAVAKRLVGRGVAKRTHVGISFGNNPDFVVSMLAVCRIGAVAVPISTFAPGRELLRLVRYGDLAGILTTRDVVGSDQVDRLAGAIDGLAASSPELHLLAAPNLRWIELADAGGGPPPPWALRPEAGDRIDDALLEAIEGDVHPSDVALMIHTSGTTADPKGVPHLHDTVCFRAAYLSERMQYRAGEVTLASHVLFWIGGLTMSMFTCLASGGTSVWHERFEAGAYLDLIEREKVNRLITYAHQSDQMLAHPAVDRTDRSSLRVGDPRLMTGGHEGGFRTPEGHRMALGMTETFGPFSWGSGGTAVMGPVEDVQPGLTVRVVDDTGVDVPEGGTGEIVLRGRCVTPGYYKRPKGTGFDDDGWFHTGDRGRVDGDVIHFLGRMTEMIKTSGANVAPAEVVEALLALDGVTEAYVLPLDDATRGEVVSAAVVAPGAGLDADAVRAQLRRDLSPFKVPAKIAFFRSDEIPWTPTFKVRRHELTRMIDEHGR